jgi:hypothetical protein
LIVNRENGALRVIENTYDKGGGKITFKSSKAMDNAVYKCSTQGWSVGLFDLAVRFADLNGDGKQVYPEGVVQMAKTHSRHIAETLSREYLLTICRADYICLDPDGRAVGSSLLGCIYYTVD